MCFGTKSQPSQYTYSSPPRPSSPSRNNHTSNHRSSVPVVAAAVAPSAAPAPAPTTASPAMEQVSTTVPHAATAAAAAADPPPPPSYEESLHEPNSRTNSDYNIPQAQQQNTQPDLPIPVSRRPSGQTLPIPVGQEETNQSDLPIPVHAPTPADDQTLPIPISSPHIAQPPHASRSLSVNSSTSTPTSTTSQQQQQQKQKQNNKKKSGTNWNPFATPRQKDPSLFRADRANPNLHAKPAVPSPAVGFASTYDAEQAYAQGFSDAQAGITSRTPWGLTGEHYSRGYRIAAEARARSQGYPAEANGGQGWGGNNAHVREALRTGKVYPQSRASAGTPPSSHASPPLAGPTSASPPVGAQLQQQQRAAVPSPQKQPRDGAQELGTVEVQSPAQWTPRVDVTGQVELPSKEASAPHIQSPSHQSTSQSHERTSNWGNNNG